MEPLVVVTHPEQIELEARPIDYSPLPEGAVALGYYRSGAGPSNGHLVARGVVAPEAVEAIHGLLARPVSLALAAAEDEAGNIEARICLVLPIDADMLPGEDENEEPEEPWRSSVPQIPAGIESAAETAEDEEGKPKLALLPIGNVVRANAQRHHPGNVAEDVREMLENLVEGHSQDAVSKAIDDLLRSL